MKIDSRDLHFYTKYGQATNLPTDINFDTNIKDIVQVAGDVECTAITICDIATDITGVLYDYNDLYNRTPHDLNGADPRDTISTALKGVKRLDNGVIEFPFKSYRKAHTGQYDDFDNVRSALQIAQRGIALWTPWFREWNGQTRLPYGQNIISYHMYEIEGVKVVNGEVVLIIEAWLGYKIEITRDVFNDVMTRWSSNTAVLCDADTSDKFDITIYMKIIDLLKNFLVYFQKQTVTPPSVPVSLPVPPPPEKTPSEKLYDISKGLLKTHLTLNENVDKEVGCAQALSYVLKKAGYPIPDKGISSTLEMKFWLDKNFIPVENSTIGCVIINVSYTGKTGWRGHCGIFGKWQIMSNDSTNGLWSAHWNIKNWHDFYEIQGGMKTYYFTPKV